MENFLGNKKIILQKSTANMAYNFEFTVNSATCANDGYLPFGTNIATVVAIVRDVDENMITGIIGGTPSVVNNVVTILLSYLDTAPKTALRIIIKYILDTGAVDEADFPRLYME